MKNISIRSPGRFGNFIIKLKNALHIALFYDYNIILPDHKFLNTKYIVINKNITQNNKTLRDQDDFYYRDRIANIDKSLFQQNKEKVSTLINEICSIKKETPFGENDLLIHIRSGDICSGGGAHHAYLTPPLSYYTNIIKKNKFDTIYLVAEDKKNPCIIKLLEIYPDIKFKIQTLEEDIKLILRAKNIIISFGTFIPGILTFSNICKKVYSPSYFIPEIAESIIIDYIELSEYYNMMMPWKNSKEQNMLMLSYCLKE